MDCERCMNLEAELAETRRQLDEANARAARATDLMMKGEQLRDRMMLGSILAGGNVEEKKSNMVYLLTGKRL